MQSTLTWWQQMGLGALIPSFAFLAAYLNNRQGKAQNLTDQLQEELNRHSARIERLETRERLRDDYIQALRKHISDGLPPPPPEWPEGLR